MNDLKFYQNTNYKEWFNPFKYEDLYRLPVSEFFTQIAIRDMYLGCRGNKHKLDTITIQRLLKGEVILPSDDYVPYEYIQHLSFNKAVLIASQALGMVDRNILSLEQPKGVNEDNDNLLASSPLFFSMLENLKNKHFENKTFDEAVYGRKTIDSKMTIEVDLELDTHQLVKKFELFIEKEKKLFKELNNQSSPNKKIENYIQKLKGYKLFEVYDLLAISNKLDINIKRKDLAFFLVDGWTEEDIKSKPIAHIDKIFDFDFYSKYITSKN